MDVYQSLTSNFQYILELFNNFIYEKYGNPMENTISLSLTIINENSFPKLQKKMF